MTRKDVTRRLGLEEEDRQKQNPREGPELGYFTVDADRGTRLAAGTERVTLRDLFDLTARVEDKIDKVDVKVERTSLRMDTLVATTNHRLDDFRAEMIKRDTDVDKALDRKADKDDLLTSWGEKMMTNRFIRWGVGVAFAATVASVTVNHWWHLIFSWLLHLAEG